MSILETETVPIYVLKLNKTELSVIYAALQNVGGDPMTSPRKNVDDVLNSIYLYFGVSRCYDDEDIKELKIPGWHMNGSGYFVEKNKE